MHATVDLHRVSVGLTLTIGCAFYMRCLPHVDKIGISFEADLGDQVRAADLKAGKAVSSWLTEAAAAKFWGGTLGPGSGPIPHERTSSSDSSCHSRPRTRCDHLNAETKRSVWHLSRPPRNARRRSPRPPVPGAQTTLLRDEQRREF